MSLSTAAFHVWVIVRPDGMIDSLRGLFDSLAAAEEYLEALVPDYEERQRFEIERWPVYDAMPDPLVPNGSMT